jgi:Family of unknown function (DUF6941)
VPEIESLILANHAEAHNGLLYVMGGGWTNVNQVVMPGSPPPPFHFGVALTVLVPWTETNKRHRAVVYMEPEDGGDPLLRIEAEFETGRPPGAVEGADQRVVLALSGEVVFPGPGGYRAVAELGPKATRFVSFRVKHQAGPPMLRSA